MYPRVYVPARLSVHAPPASLHPADPRIVRPAMPPAIWVLAALALMITLGAVASVGGVIIGLTVLEASSDVAHANR